MNRNWLIALLVVSISLNLLLVGIFVGRVMFGPPQRPPLDWAVSGLSDETRQQVRAKMREHLIGTRPLRRDFREAQDKLRDALLKDPYDPADVDQALVGLREAFASMQSSMHQQMSEVLADLSPEERLQVYRMLSQPGGPRRPPREDDR